MGTNPLIGENPDLDDLRRLEEAIYEFNVQATGISYGRPFASFLRDAEKAVVGGISGWTWGKTCFMAIFLSQRNCESRDKVLGFLSHTS
jgi:hypothetical protein